MPIAGRTIVAVFLVAGLVGLAPAEAYELTLSGIKEAALAEFEPQFRSQWLGRMRAKLCMADEQEDDAALIEEWLRYLQDNELDFTLSFRELASRAAGDGDDRFGEFEQKWRQRVLGQGRAPDDVMHAMNAVNPLFIPRNHRIEQAIAQAVDGDTTMFRELNELLARPFDEQPALARYVDPPEPAQRVTQTFCGT